MPELPALALTHADTRDFLRGCTVTEFTGEHAELLIRAHFPAHRQVLELVPMEAQP